MPQVPETKEEMREIARRAHALYDESIRAQVEPEHIGEFVTIDVETGDFEIAKRSLDASLRVRERHPDGVLFLMRIGYKTAYTMGGRMQRDIPQAT